MDAAVFQALGDIRLDNVQPQLEEPTKPIVRLTGFGQMLTPAARLKAAGNRTQCRVSGARRESALGAKAQKRSSRGVGFFSSERPPAIMARPAAIGKPPNGRARNNAGTTPLGAEAGDFATEKAMKPSHVSVHAPLSSVTRLPAAIRM